jgi:putative nucleotidyltransferase with HDIG domain
MADPREIINQIDDFPPVPNVVNQILAAAEDPKSSMSAVSNIITYDPVMTANLLKVCNSAYYGLSKEINSIHEATVFLGLDKIVELCLFRCAFENLKKAQHGYNLAEGQLVKQSISTAMITKSIAERLKVANKHLLFTASLLKDIGKLIMERYVAQSIDEINHLVKKEQMSFSEAEKAVLGIDHEGLGGMMMERWGFSSKMSFIIANHHLQAPQARKDVGTSTVYLAEAICMLIGVCAESDVRAFDHYDEAVALLHISEGDVDHLMIAFLENREKVETLLKYI